MLSRLICLSLSLVLWIEPAFAVTTQLRYQGAARRCASTHLPQAAFNQSFEAIDDLRTALTELRDSSTDAVTRQKREARLDIRDLPMWSKFSREMTHEVQSALRELGLEDIVDVKVHYVPSRKGLIGAIEKARYVFPMRQDYEKPIRDEVVKGGPGVVVAESTASLFAILAMPPESAIPLLLSHFTLLATRMAYQKTLANWNMRSSFESPAARISEGLFKDYLVGCTFIFNYKVSSNLPLIYESLRHNATEALGNFAHSIGDHLANPGLTGAINTAFFYLTFQRGGFRWMKIHEDDPIMADGTRRAMSILTPATFMVSGPTLMWASTTAQPVISIAGVGLNGGQLGLLALTAAGSIVAYNPRILDPTVRFLDRYVHGPIDRSGAFIRDRFRRRE